MAKVLQQRFGDSKTLDWEREGRLEALANYGRKHRPLERWDS